MEFHDSPKVFALLENLWSVRKREDNLIEMHSLREVLDGDSFLESHESLI
jgi:hypothetical protein